MGEGHSGVRLRQAVLVAEDLEPVADLLRREIGLGEPFRDPGVGEFGLANVVFAIGDCFLEVVSPVREGTAAGRRLERAGEGGYMALFDIEDLEGARRRAQELGVRIVWRIDLPDISGTHLHPADVPGAIVSLDRSAPYGTWRWGGPEWTGRRGAGATGRLTGITVAAHDAPGAMRRWGEVLGVAGAEVSGERSRLQLDGGEVRFTTAVPGVPEQITVISLQIPADVRAGRDVIEIGSARLELSDLER